MEPRRFTEEQILPIPDALTTQEVAHHLNVSHRYLIELLERGEIPYHLVGTRRRVRFKDLQAYKKAGQARSARALDELAEQARTSA